METNPQVPLYVTLCVFHCKLGYPPVTRVFEYKKKYVFTIFSQTIARLFEPVIGQKNYFPVERTQIHFSN